MRCRFRRIYKKVGITHTLEIHYIKLWVRAQLNELDEQAWWASLYNSSWIVSLLSEVSFRSASFCLEWPSLVEDHWPPWEAGTDFSRFGNLEFLFEPSSHHRLEEVYHRNLACFFVSANRRKPFLVIWNISHQDWGFSPLEILKQNIFTQEQLYCIRWGVWM